MSSIFSSSYLDPPLGLLPLESSQSIKKERVENLASPLFKQLAEGVGQSRSNLSAAQKRTGDRCTEKTQCKKPKKKPRPPLSEHPVAREWDHNKNKELKRSEGYTQGSAVKVWWICSKKKHSYSASIFTRCREKEPSGCPVCSGRGLDRRPPVSNHPVAREWDYMKNLDRDKRGKIKTPKDYTQGCQKKVYWVCKQCPEEHSYLAAIFNRCGKKATGCPVYQKGNNNKVLVAATQKD
ncbi:MAG: hypothetical protein S4CHLAM45_15380 [Chlamydiales bacterium]|nr:hypothetical protein [Chlamydiales bacterium]MCH9620155.1 hypothetical protein [Chlamydiales bacterium]MCH9623625.1 hypothetical protein [Chlamydiales bacterium]